MMPYAIRKLPRSNKVKVVNTRTGAVKARRTTLKKAKNQIKLLEGIEHGTLIPRGR